MQQTPRARDGLRAERGEDVHDDAVADDLQRAALYKRMSGWSSKASVAVERFRGRGLKARGGRRDAPSKVLKDRQRTSSPRAATAAATASSTARNVVAARPPASKTTSPPFKTSSAPVHATVLATVSACLRTGSARSKVSIHADGTPWSAAFASGIEPNSASSKYTTRRRDDSSSSSSSSFRDVSRSRRFHSRICVTASDTGAHGIPRTRSRTSPSAGFAYDAHSALARPVASVKTPPNAYPKSVSNETTSSFTARNRGMSAEGMSALDVASVTALRVEGPHER
eukprot:30950-Pelagococcus_subviridis.AAC.2